MKWLSRPFKVRYEMFTNTYNLSLDGKSLLSRVLTICQGILNVQQNDATFKYRITTALNLPGGYTPVVTGDCDTVDRGAH